MSTRVLSFVGAKGGSGATTLALEVTRALSKFGRVAIVDADLAGRRNLAVMLDAVRRFDEHRTQGAVPIVDCDGFRAAELVHGLVSSFSLRAKSVEELTEALAGYETIVVDVPQPFAGALQPLVSRTSRFLIVMEPTVLATASARSLITDAFGIVGRAKIEVVVIDREPRAAEVSRTEIERLLEVKVLAEIPHRNDRHYAKAIAALARYLAQIPPGDGIGLLTSNTPIGERRSDERREEMRRDATALREHAPAADAQARTAAWSALKVEIHLALGDEIDAAVAAAMSDADRDTHLREKVGAAVRRVVALHQDEVSLESIAPLCDEIIAEALGLGPLEDLLSQPDVTEIMVNGPDKIFVERAGKLESTSKRFASPQQLRLVIERIITPLGRRVDESSPMVDARLPDGSRVNVIIEPLALDGATMSIRRFGTRKLEIEDLVRLGAVSPQVVNLLRASIQARLNVVVSGGTGSGKTTFLNILSGFIPDNERIVTIEDAAELQLRQAHVVRLESRPPNIEGKGEIKIRDLVRNSLRMRPDRVIVGECRGGEALDMLQAMNTGHDGSLTTVHANTARDALSRIETMVMMAGFDLPVRAIREQISGAVDLIIQTARLRDGSRKIMSITEVVGMEGDVITMQEIVAFEQRGMDEDGKVVGSFAFSGVQPHCLTRFDELGIAYEREELASIASAGGFR
ncbi:MAG: type secretion system protein [Candidatus Eremiobacteraeota bacterium]|nr:type secretion system protein [Candidatus Eremiobacteraeota bacterium]